MVTIKGMKDVKKRLLRFARNDGTEEGRLLRFARNDSKEIKGDCHGNIMQKHGIVMTGWEKAIASLRSQ